MKEETIKIFNPIQANVFIQNNCKVVGSGFGSRSKIYIEFLRDEHFNKILRKWQNHEFQVNN